MRLATAQLRSSVVAGRARRGGRVPPAMLVFDAARRTLTNCLKGWTITALTSDMVAAGSGRCGSLSLSRSLRQLHNHWSYGVEAYSASYTALLACKRGARGEQ